MPSIINATTTGGVVVSGDNSGSLQLQNSGVTELTVASTGVTVADDLLFNSGYGSAVVGYGCRAWVNFNGTGTVAIRASGNVSSITDNGTGAYTANFTNDLIDANYSAVASASTPATRANQASTKYTSSTSSCKIEVSTTAGVLSDASEVSLAIFR
jgi:hypothetical protein